MRVTNHYKTFFNFLCHPVYILFIGGLNIERQVTPSVTIVLKIGKGKQIFFVKKKIAPILLIQNKRLVIKIQC